MKKFAKTLTCMILSLSVLVSVSCSRNNKPLQPPSKALELTLSERTIKNNVRFINENVGGLSETAVLEKIRSYAAGIDVSPLDAALDGLKWSVKDEKAGRMVNVEKTLESLINASEGETIRPVIEEVLPPITAQMLAGNISIIGRYTTVLLDRDPSRVNNIKLAAKKINYRILSPGEEFSFNKAVGKRTQAKGYEDAPVIVNTPEGPKKSTGIGGGICQLSTTLYNALQECNIEILERHLHSKDVGYVPKGEDATVNYKTADFRFRNNRSYPIMIKTYLKSRSLTVEIIENRNETP